MSHPTYGARWDSRDEDVSNGGNGDLNSNPDRPLLEEDADEFGDSLKFTSEPLDVEPLGPPPLCSWAGLQSRLFRILPILTWLPNYPIKENLQGDLVTGLTLGIVLVPQGMAYALLADLPEHYGLYAVLTPPILYMFFGTCRHASMGPFSLISLLVGKAANKFYDPDTQTSEYVDIAMQLGAISGAMLIVMSLLGLGALATLISESVLAGFITASAILIASNQVKHFVGVDLPRSLFYELVYNTFDRFEEINYRAVLVGTSTILMLFIIKYINRTYLKGKIPIPGPLLVLIIWTLVQFLAGFDIDVVGHVPSGLPDMWWPQTSPDLVDLFIEAGLLAIVNYVLAISVAKKQALAHNYQVDSTQEMLALGICNLGGAFFHAYPPAPSLTRSALAGTTGVKTPLQGCFTVMLMILVLELLMGTLYHLPMAVLAAIVIAAALDMIVFSEAVHLYRVSRPDFWMWQITFWTTLVLDIVPGISTGIAVSLIFLLIRQMRPPTTRLGRVPGSVRYEDIETSLDAEPITNIQIICFNASLYFTNREHLEQEIWKAVEERPCEAVILDMRGVSFIDISGLRTLLKIVKACNNRGIQFYFAQLQKTVVEIVQVSDFYEVVPKSHVFTNVHSAVRFVENDIERRQRKKLAESNDRDYKVSSPSYALQSSLSPSSPIQASINA